MRPLCLPFWVISVSLMPMAVQAAGAPQIAARTQLSALPAAQSVGEAGPFNRIAFDVERFGPPDAAASVTCFYPGGLHYRCDASIDEPETPGARRRVTVTIPDLGRGKQVIVRFSTTAGHQDVTVELANAPQVVHEIEALPLPDGGRVATGSTGQPAPVMNVVSTRATTTPAMAAAATPAAGVCHQVQAEWVGASATDPVFQSQFGSLNGSVVASRPVMSGSRVTPENLPEWLVTYPLSATRVQFIAHYEVIYRVSSCRQRVISGT
jgi:hypothetical protein